MESFQEFLVFSPDYQSLIAFVSTTDVQKSFTVAVDWNFPLNPVKPQLFLQNDESAENDDEEKQEHGKNETPEKKCLHNIAVAESTGMLAYTASDKSLFVSKIDGKSTKVLSRRAFIRTSSCMRFSNCGRLLFLVDKTGDVFEYSCEEENVNSRGRYIMGHISLILDLQLTPE
jgi:hypothetical protein